MFYKKSVLALSGVLLLCVTGQATAMKNASSLHSKNQTIAITLKNAAQHPNLLNSLAASPLEKNAQIISLHGKYSIPLTSGSRAAMTLLSSGIVWTEVPQIRNDQLQTQPIYFTPYVSSDIPSRNTSVDMWSNAQPLTTFPVGTDRQGNKYLPVTLYQSRNVIIFSQVKIRQNGQDLISYYVQPRQGQRMQLFQGIKTSDQHEYLYQQGNIIILLIQYSTPFGPINFGQEVNLTTGEKNNIPKTPGMLSVMQKNGTMQIQAGMLIYSFDQKGNMSQRNTQVNPTVLTAIRKHLGKTIARSFLPSVLATSTLWLSYQKDGTTTMVIKDTETSAPLSIVSFKHAQTKGNDPATFAHEFTLSSQEGPTIGWHMTGNFKKQNWTASFVAKGWTYSIGPFSSPAEKNASTLLSQLLAYAKQTTPIPYGSGGTATITLAHQNSMEPVHTVITFPLTANMYAIFEGPGYSPFRNITLWTFVAAKP